jgi:hypothetical protein
MYHRLINNFGCIRYNSKVTWVKWNLVSVYLEIVLVLMQDRCTVCAKHTIGKEIILGTPYRTPRQRGSCEPHFGMFGDSVRVSAR